MVISKASATKRQESSQSRCNREESYLCDSAEKLKAQNEISDNTKKNNRDGDYFLLYNNFFQCYCYNTFSRQYQSEVCGKPLSLTDNLNSRLRFSYYLKGNKS